MHDKLVYLCISDSKFQASPKGIEMTIFEDFFQSPKIVIGQMNKKVMEMVELVFKRIHKADFRYLGV